MKLSAMITFRDPIRLGYPFLEAILSMIPIVDEYLINDGGSKDGTIEILDRLEEQYPDKIIRYNMKDQPGTHWQCVSDQYNKMIEDAEGDWIFQGDADELMHENSVMRFRKRLEEIKSPDVLALRHLRWEVFNHWSETGWYHYWPARTCRNVDGIFQSWKSHGGDEFLIGDWDWVRYPPRCIKIYGYLIWHFYVVFPENNLAKRENDATYIAQGDKGRVEQYEWYRENYDPKRVPEWYGQKVVYGLPSLMLHHPAKMRYEVDEGLFDKKRLERLTGLDYT